MTGAAVEARRPADRRVEAVLPDPIGWERLTRMATAPVLERRYGRLWWGALALALALTGVMAVAVGWLLIGGIGIWGLNQSNVWGFAIANYVWWIGIGNAGTLISAMLLLTRQRWRASINRYAEAMTLFAAMIAGLFPILHLGRPYLFYWLTPYPNTMELWPQWRSPLVWDLFAIAAYLMFSLMFWYSGLIPDLATVRDRARGRAARVLYGVAALGWRGSAGQWRRLESFYYAMAALGAPLVISVHSVVGMDFAASLMPGWQETIFPPYFVVGAMFSGFAMVVTMSVVIRWGLDLGELITPAHLDAMAKILLFGGTVLGLAYATEWFMAWYGGGEAERFLLRYMFAGDYAPWYWLMLVCNVLVPQLFWARAARRSVPVLLAASLAINVGMWLERILITVQTLSRGHLPSAWKLYAPTVWDWALLAGTLGFFLLALLALFRLAPIVSIHELRELAWEREELA